MPEERAGGATGAGTAAYRDRAVASGLGVAGHYRTLDRLAVSSIGIGTYLGPHDERADRAYEEAIARALELGTNLVDSAVNYRCQRSERAIGRALGALLAKGSVRREEVVVATKGGFIPFDGAPPRDPGVYVRERVLGAGLARPEEIVAGCHCMAPRYVRAELATSLRNLGLARIDLYYLHNPETQLGAVARPEFLTRIRSAFETLERQVAAGRIGRYGVATWNGFRRPPDARDHLSLAELDEAARAVAGPGHHFRLIQLPYNLAMPEAYASATQLAGGERLTVVEAATRLGIAVAASAAILQGQLARRLPNQVAEAFPGLDTPAQRALQFTRSTPGITVALIGMARPEHVEENLRLARTAPSPVGVDSLFERR